MISPGHVIYAVFGKTGHTGERTYMTAKCLRKAFNNFRSQIMLFDLPYMPTFVDKLRHESRYDPVEARM